MCWISRKDAIKQIADKDIPVFKVAIYDGNIIISAYRFFEYEKGIIYSNEIDKICYYDNVSLIRKGFHSYSNNVKIDIGCHSIYVTRPKEVICSEIFCNSEIPFIFTSKDISSDAKYVKLNCIIPKGSEYYLNEKGEYVSNKIIIKDVLEKY